MIARSIDSGAERSSSALALAAACSAGVPWGSGALVVDVLVDRHGFTPQDISFWRLLIGAAVLVAVFGRSLSWTRSVPWRSRGDRSGPMRNGCRCSRARKWAPC